MWLTIWSGSAFAAEQKTEDEGALYWNQLNRVATDCFSGMDIDLELSGGYSRIYEEDESQPVAKAAIKIPLYNASERISRREKKIKYLEQGAKLIGEYETAQAKIELLEEEVIMCEKAIVQEGLDGIQKYFKIRENIVVAIAEKRAAARKLEGMLKGCK